MIPLFRIHPEGRSLLLGLFIVLVAILVAVALRLPVWFWPVSILSIGFFLLILQFFRNPIRRITMMDNDIIYAPADGKVVVIEETEEQEYFKGPRQQISIFMSPLNVHVNRNPIGGEVKYYKYHPGKYLVAWHPKSSTENERTTTVLATGKTEIMVRQIAGAVARRIKNYLTEGQQVIQGEDMGFIKFGSRVDVFLPLDAQLKVEIGQVVRGNETIIAR
ncbi:MAG: phosphatidylserine decarboxylase family protein, partial [Bacteroidota bacterium]